VSRASSKRIGAAHASRRRAVRGQKAGNSLPLAGTRREPGPSYRQRAGFIARPPARVKRPLVLHAREVLSRSRRFPREPGSGLLHVRGPLSERRRHQLAFGALQSGVAQVPLHREPVDDRLERVVLGDSLVSDSLPGARTAASTGRDLAQLRATGTEVTRALAPGLQPLGTGWKAERPRSGAGNSTRSGGEPPSRRSGTGTAAGNRRSPSCTRASEVTCPPSSPKQSKISDLTDEDSIRSTPLGAPVPRPLARAGRAKRRQEARRWWQRGRPYSPIGKTTGSSTPPGCTVDPQFTTAAGVAPDHSSGQGRRIRSKAPEPDRDTVWETCKRYARELTRIGWSSLLLLVVATCFAATGPLKQCSQPAQPTQVPSAEETGSDRTPEAPPSAWMRRTAMLGQAVLEEVGKQSTPKVSRARLGALPAGAHRC